MPMFHDPDRRLEQARKAPIPIPIPPEPSTVEGRRSEESIRTEFCEGPVLEEPLQALSTAEPEFRDPSGQERLEISDREELIERIKRGESPTWVPNRKVCLIHAPL